MRSVDPEIVTVLITGWKLDPDDERLVAFDFLAQKPFDDLHEVEAIVERALLLKGSREAG